MKTRIRQGVFETNSSSTHAVSVCTKQQWDDYLAGKLWMNNDLNLLPEEDAKEANAQIISDAKNRAAKGGWTFDESDYDYELYYPYDDMYENNYDWFNEKFTLNGNEIVAYGYYGTDY